MLTNIVSSGELEIDISDLSEKPETSILEGNELLDKIEVTKTNKKRYVGKVAETLIDEYSCNKQSEINLIKKTRKRELYEVNCIKEVKRLIFDCPQMVARFFNEKLFYYDFNTIFRNIIKWLF